MLLWLDKQFPSACSSCRCCSCPSQHTYHASASSLLQSDAVSQVAQQAQVSPVVIDLCPAIVELSAPTRCQGTWDSSHFFVSVPVFRIFIAFEPVCNLFMAEPSKARKCCQSCLDQVSRCLALNMWKVAMEERCLHSHRSASHLGREEDRVTQTSCHVWSSCFKGCYVDLQISQQPSRQVDVQSWPD